MRPLDHMHGTKRAAFLSLCQLLTDPDAAEKKDVHRLVLLCCQTRTRDSGDVQIPGYCDHTIAARTTALRSLCPDIANAQFTCILPHSDPPGVR